MVSWYIVFGAISADFHRIFLRTTQRKTLSLLFLSVVLYWIIKRRKKFTLPDRKDYHYIVVGGGSSGCVLANRLSEDPKVNVLLLEAGPEATNKHINIPLTAVLLQRTDIDWQYSTTPQIYTHHRIHNWPRGKVLGGSSCLNWMLYVRGSSEDYNLWAKEMGCTGWSYDEVLPYFIKSEDRITSRPFDKKYHGVGGNLAVTDMNPPNPLTKKFVEACKQSGIPFNTDYNGEKQEGVGFAQFCIKKGVRWHTNTAFLKPIRNRKNLTICTNSHVIKLNNDGRNRITGVMFKSDFDNKIHTVNATREVILSGGAVGSPHILLLSGIGPREDLKKIGIPLLRDIPAVGQHMKDHLMVGMSYEVLQPVSYDKILVEKISNVVKYVVLKKGPLISQGLEGMAFIRTKLCTFPYPIPDMQIHFVCAGGSENTAKNLGIEYVDDPKRGKWQMMIIPTLLHPESTGSVTLRSSSPFDHPIVHPNYFCSEKDLNTMVEGMKISREIMKQQAWNGFAGDEYIIPDISYDSHSDEYLREYARRLCFTVYHPTSSCRMGSPSDVTTVVNPQLQVHGIDGLRIADCSIMPDIPSGNTHAPAVMVGEKGSDIIKSYWASKKEKTTGSDNLKSKI